MTKIRLWTLPAVCALASAIFALPPSRLFDAPSEAQLFVASVTFLVGHFVFGLLFAKINAGSFATRGYAILFVVSGLLSLITASVVFSLVRRDVTLLYAPSLFALPGLFASRLINQSPHDTKNV